MCSCNKWISTDITVFAMRQTVKLASLLHINFISSCSFIPNKFESYLNYKNWFVHVWLFVQQIRFHLSNAVWRIDLCEPLFRHKNQYTNTLATNNSSSKTIQWKTIAMQRCSAENYLTTTQWWRVTMVKSHSGEEPQWWIIAWLLLSNNSP